ncbi:MAG: Nif3-like dinuclear metal center hexameric protein [Bifidobacteriaceae bacterium]|jgi:dinuclear metal center YbgI/SA1388 family protein|nr:Nif3-like dinuclear metal center hexameric protein [Bifidobacteriaceae bacterium]
MGATVGEAVGLLDSFFPPALKEDWDHVGLVCGDPAAPLRRVAWAVDPTLNVVERAIEWGADLLVVHHPLLLRGVNSVAATNFKGGIVHQLIKGDCALYTAHTNADAAIGGVAETLARKIGLRDLRPLVPAASDPQAGLGRVGHLAEPVSLLSLAQRLASLLPPNNHGVRIAGDTAALVRTAAVLPGAGDSLFDAVRAAQVDVYVTADLRHHPALEAREAADFAGSGKPYLLDVSHAASEWAWLEPAAGRLVSGLEVLGSRVETWVIREVADPWTARVGRTDE